jgi:hypothetical protein
MRGTNVLTLTLLAAVGAWSCGPTSHGEPEARAADTAAQPGDRQESGEEVFRRQLGEASPKIRAEEGRTWVYAGGELERPDTEWFDFTNAPMAAEELQFGIGKDGIPSIDDPVFVSPDDPRLLDIPVSPYREDEVPKTNDEIMVVGYVESGEAKAYPTALLDRHEVVNDRIDGKPVTVGW